MAGSGLALAIELELAAYPGDKATVTTIRRLNV